VRSGDAKIDCRIAGARCSENGGSDDKKITTDAFSLEIAGGLRVGCGCVRVCAERGKTNTYFARYGTDKIA
jgi:hypothetical protein